MEVPGYYPLVGIFGLVLLVPLSILVFRGLEALYRLMRGPSVGLLPKRAKGGDHVGAGVGG